MNLAVRDIRHNAGPVRLHHRGHRPAADDRHGHGRNLSRPDFRSDACSWIRSARICGSCRAARAARSRKSPAFPPISKTACAAVPGVARSAPLCLAHHPARASAAGRCAWWCKDFRGPRTRATGCRWLPGRPLRQAHYEMIADRSLGLPLGEKLKLGKDVYEVVGLTRGMVGTGGDGLMLFHRQRRGGDPVRRAGRGHAPGTRRAPRPRRRHGSWPRAAAAARPRRRSLQRHSRARPAAGQRRAGDAAGRRG